MTCEPMNERRQKFQERKKQNYNVTMGSKSLDPGESDRYFSHANTDSALRTSRNA